MPGRPVSLTNGEYYHVYNRGSDKRDLFLQPRDYKVFQQTFYYYQFLGPKPRFSHFSKSSNNLFDPFKNEKYVDIVCYCLMPNHFHFLLRQLKDNGISIFLSQICNSYTKYFNIKYKRVGPLLQGRFKSILIESDGQLIHVSRYIHLNPIVSKLVKDLDSYKWSSYPEYLMGANLICNPDEVMGLFSSIQKYKEFVNAQIDYGTTLEVIKHRAIDIDD